MTFFIFYKLRVNYQMVEKCCHMCIYSVHKPGTTGSHIQPQQQQAGMGGGLQQCMPGIDVPLLGVDSADQLGMDSDDLVPTLTVCHLSSLSRAWFLSI